MKIMQTTSELKFYESLFLFNLFKFEIFENCAPRDKFGMSFII